MSASARRSPTPRRARSEGAQATSMARPNANAQIAHDAQVDYASRSTTSTVPPPLSIAPPSRLAVSPGKLGL